MTGVLHTSDAIAARFRARYARRIARFGSDIVDTDQRHHLRWLRQRELDRARFGWKRTWINNTAELRDVLLANLGRVPKPARELYRAVLAEFGVVGERRFYRALTHHLKAGRVRRIGTRGDSASAYVRAR